MTLATDRVLDHAWRTGIGVAAAVIRARELSDPLGCDAVTRDATLLVSGHQACGPDEALSRLVFVARHTDRRVQQIAAEVVAAATTAQGLTGGAGSRPYRFTL
ncbi:MAG TPA: hypothetical protein VGC71_02655 [Gaiellales bacterium]|jgi:hypothetical protein